jgi:hypothetical protein
MKDSASTRESLNKPMLELLKSFSTMTEEQQNTVLELQGKLTAIQTFDKNIPLNDIKNIADADAIIKDKNISKEAVDAGIEHIKSGKFAPQGVPPSGALAIKLGYVTQQTCDTLLAAQAAERTLRAYEACEGKVQADLAYAFKDINKLSYTRNFNKAVADALTADIAACDKKANELIENPKFARPYINGEKTPKKLQAAQSINHIVDCLAGFIAANTEMPPPAAAKENIVNKDAPAKPVKAKQPGIFKSIISAVGGFFKAITSIITGNSSASKPSSKNLPQESKAANNDDANKSVMNSRGAIPAAITTSQPAMLWLAKHSYVEAKSQLEALAKEPKNGIKADATQAIDSVITSIEETSKAKHPNVIKSLDFDKAIAKIQRSGQALVEEVSKEYPRVIGADKGSEIGEKLAEGLKIRLEQAKNLQPEKTKGLERAAS